MQRIFNVTLKYLDIREKQIAAETIDQNALDGVDLASFFQIAEMAVSRLNAEKTPRRLCGTDDHFGKGEDDPDQYAVDRSKKQHTEKRARKDQTFRAAHFKKPHRQLKLRCPKQRRDHDRGQHRNRQISDESRAA